MQFDTPGGGGCYSHLFYGHSTLCGIKVLILDITAFLSVLANKNSNKSSGYDIRGVVDSSRASCVYVRVTAVPFFEFGK